MIPKYVLKLMMQFNDAGITSYGELVIWKGR